MIYEITQSLLSAWMWMFDSYDQEKAYTDFMKALRREPSETTQAMQDGKDFEDDVYSIVMGCDVNNPAWEKGARAVAEYIKGAAIQVPLRRDIEVNGTVYRLIGILDALKAGVISDVKFSTKSIESVDMYGKYYYSPQHPAYMYLVPEATRFQYLVSDGEDIYVETYQRSQTPYIGDYIEQFINSITSMKLLDLYHEKWKIAE